jgi:hypothetical protein
MRFVATMTFAAVAAGLLLQRGDAGSCYASPSVLHDE